MFRLFAFIFSVTVALMASDAKTVDLSEFSHIDAIKQGRIVPLEAKVIDGDIYQLLVAAMTPDGVKVVELMVTKDKETVILGASFNGDMTQKREMTLGMDGKKRLDAYKKNLFAGEELAAPIVYGNGPDKYYVFTDPDCPFCKKFDAVMETLGDRATFYIYPMSLAGLRGHYPDSVNNILVLPKEKRYAAMHDHMAGPRLNKAPEKRYGGDDMNHIQTINAKVRATAKKFGAKGTPSVYDENGQKIKDWRVYFPKKYSQKLSMLTIGRDGVDLIEKKLGGGVPLSDAGEKLYLVADVDSPTFASHASGKTFERIRSRYRIALIPFSMKDESLKALDLMRCDGNRQVSVFKGIVGDDYQPCFEKADLLKECRKHDSGCMKQLFLAKSIAEKSEAYGETGFAYFDQSGEPIGVEDLL